jgi:hypothetical protein
MKKTSAKKRTIAAPKGYVLRRDVQRDHQAFLFAMDRAIEFHRTNTNDPHNVGTAVMVALTEVRDCFKAYIY